MYHAHQTQWFAIGIAVCVVLAVASAVATRFGKLKLPRYIFFLLVVLAFLQMAIMSRLGVVDDENFRRELQNINPGGVSNLMIRANAGNHAISSTNEINALFNQLQRVQAVAPHHSSPLDFFELQFVLDGHEYRYRVAHDSERADEYWVLETERAGQPGREIGRIQSTQLKPVFEGLLTNQP